MTLWQVGYVLLVLGDHFVPIVIVVCFLWLLYLKVHNGQLGRSEP